MSRTPTTQSASETTPLLRSISPVAESGFGDAETAVQTPSSQSILDQQQQEQQPPNGRATAEEEDDSPLLKDQIFFLCLARTVEPMAYFCIFPFINEMLYETGEMGKKDVGFYSGLIESLFSLTQMFLMIFWGRAADRIGRKPVLVLSLSGASIFTGIFGLSKRVWQMILFRCCAGLFSGTIVTIRTMISENSTAKTQARAFSIFAFAGNVGLSLGPLIGGSLSNPTKQYPIDRIFKNIKFFEEFPYFLPTLTTGTVAIITVICSAVFLKETLKRKSNTGEPAAPPMSAWQVAKAPGVPIVLYLYNHVMLLAFSYTAVITVFYFTPVSLGGFELSPPQISFFIAGVGICQAIWLLVVFPPLQGRLGTVKLLKICLGVWPFLFVCAPFSNWLLKMGWVTAFWIVSPTFQFVGCGVAMAFTCVQLLLNDAAPPSPQDPTSKTANLGTLNALALAMIAGIRAFAPALFTSIFAIGVRTQFLGGYLIWLILCLLALLGLIVARVYLPDEDKKKGFVVGDRDNQGPTQSQDSVSERIEGLSNSDEEVSTVVGGGDEGEEDSERAALLGKADGIRSQGGERV